MHDADKKRARRIEIQLPEWDKSDGGTTIKISRSQVELARMDSMS